jgi:uncharacterized membrane protein YeaQ/YmgE (transglycosylase-associated protein family)
MPELLLSWVIIGVVAGFLVYLFSAGKLFGGLLTNLFIGVAGASIGGYLVSDVTHVDVTRSALTWGILLCSVASAGVLAIIVQHQAARQKK